MYQYPYTGQTPIYNSNYYPQTNILNNEKSEIRRAALFCAIPAVITALIMDFWVYPYLIITQFLGIDQQKAISFFNEPVVSAIFGVIISIITFMVPYTIAFLISGKKFSLVIPPHAPQKELWAPFLLIGIGVCAFSNIGNAALSNFFSGIGFDYNMSASEDPEGIFGFLLAIISSAMIPALVEEYAFRGILYSFVAKYGEGFSIMVTAVMFGVMHGNFRQIPFAFVLGLFLGYIRVKTGSLWICVAIHFINNFVATALSWIPEAIPIAVQNIIYTVYLAISMVCAVIGVMMLKNFDTDFLKLKRPESLCTEKQKYKWFFTSALIIVFLVLNLFNALSFIVF